MDRGPTKLFIATKAFILYQNKVLIVRESDKYIEGTNQGKFDVVGGRIKLGQRFDESLRREVKEETGLDAVIYEPFYVGEWRPFVKGEEWQIVGIFFRCSSVSDKVRLSQDHDGFLWIDPKNYENYALIDNLLPVFEAYLK